MSTVKPIPDGFHTVTPHIVCKDAAAAIEFYKAAFGAEEVMRMPGPGGQGVMHAEIQIGTSRVMLADEYPEHFVVSPLTAKTTTATMMMYVKDCDAAHAKAVKAGATEKMPPMDMFWGDRYSALVDPFGHSWAIATHIADLTPEQIMEGQAKWMESMAGGEHS